MKKTFLMANPANPLFQAGRAQLRLATEQAGTARAHAAEACVLMEIHVVYDPAAPLDRVVEGIRTILMARHGREDFTITPQQKMLDVLGSVLGVLTFAVGAMGGISLAVAGVGILTIMTIAVSERTGEIGLLRAE